MFMFGCFLFDTDTDGDGINDRLDACPNEGDAGLGIDASGCPLENNLTVNRTTAQIELAHSETVNRFGSSWELNFYRNPAYECGLSGNYTFLVVEPANNPSDEAPLWVYLHGGGFGYFDEEQVYQAVKTQDQDTWNHEETFEDHFNGQLLRITTDKGEIQDSTLTRRLQQGYRLLLVAMCDHDL